MLRHRCWPLQTVAAAVVGLLVVVVGPAAVAGLLVVAVGPVAVGLPEPPIIWKKSFFFIKKII